ncbi:MAG: (deoxy)nucleoside triphosphate pyrophosphohydrolase [Bacteroidia bacterium]|nr:(deoxy)nucleoside triphosphate pyrophosphohydrolase [Bacteroidia bacterium]
MKTVKVVCGIIQKDGKIFIARRKPEKSMGGYWEFPGGKIEKSEDEEQALKRELKEELGMAVLVGKRIGQNTHKYETITIELIAYECEFISASFQLTDHDEYNFVNPENLINFNIAPADMFFLDIL